VAVLSKHGNEYFCSTKSRNLLTSYECHLLKEDPTPLHQLACLTVVCACI